MSRRSLDIEQQLRQFQEQQQHNSKGSLFDDSQLHYVQWNFFYPVVGAASVVAVITVAVVIVMCTRVCPRIEKRDAAQTVSILASQASVISTSLTPFTCTMLFVAWLFLIALHAVFSAMRIAARKAHEGSLGTSISLTDFLVSISGAAFFLELLGTTATWVYLLYFGGRFELGAALSVPALLPSMYESMLLRGDEPDRVAVWVTHFIFLPSVFIAIAMVAPWVKREYRQARAQLNAHTQNALYRDRPEFKDLRLRARRQMQARKVQ